ncbi:hypothetical protein ACHAWF_018679, partial [Thalassiosira exigua]
VKKYKARLNVHGGNQTYGVNYFETYVPVITWFAICLMIELVDAKFKDEDMGYPNDYVGINIQHQSDGTFHFVQTALIDQIIADCGLTKSTKKNQAPVKSSKILSAHLDSPKFGDPFSYRSVVGKLNYLAQTMRPDIMYAVHSCANYSSNPRKEHGAAVLDIAFTRILDLKFKPDSVNGFEANANANFDGNLNPVEAPTDPSTVKSHTDWVIFYAGCPIIWASRLETQVALSTTEAEYIALSMSLRDVIPSMELVVEVRSKGFPVLCTEPYVYCKVFEDNSSALELARLPKF